MIVEVLPERLYSLPNIETLFRDKNRSAVFHKILTEDLTHKEMYLSVPVLIYIIKGEQIIYTCDGEKLMLKSGQLTLLPKDVYLVSDFVAENSTFEALLFFVDHALISRFKDVFLKLCGAQQGLQSDLIDVVSVARQTQRYMTSLKHVYLNQKNSEKLLEIKLLELLQLISEQQEGVALVSRLCSYPTPLKRRSIRVFMQKNFQKNLKVSDYAYLTGRSVSSFLREFKRLYDMTPNRWLIEQRLKQGRHLLLKTDLKVTEVAFEVGYENVSHFIKAYKARYGQSPNESRKKTTILKNE